MAIKDRLTKKVTKTTTTTSKRKTRLRSGIEIIDYFEMNKSISGLFIYDNNKVYVEQGGLTQLSDEVFDISLSDLIRVIVSKYENNFISVGDSYVVETENGTIINIVSRPYLKKGNFISFQKKVPYDYSIDLFLKHQILNYDISDYLKQKLQNGENVFITGASDTNPLPVLSYLSGLTFENTAIIQGIEDIYTDTPSSLVFSKHSIPFKDIIAKAFSLNHNLVVTQCSEIKELMSVLEYINSGYKHFICAFNTNSKEEFLDNLKNNIMLNYPQMSESKIVGLIASTMKNIVFLQRMKDGETRVSHISEIKKADNKLVIEDIFEFDFTNFKFTYPVMENMTVIPEIVEEDEPKPAKKKPAVNKVKKTSKPARKKEELLTEPEEITGSVRKEETVKVKKAGKTVETIQMFVKEPQEPIEEPKVEQPSTVSEESKSGSLEQDIPIPVIAPMKQLTEKVNKYKLLKEKIRQRREQKEV